MRITAAAPEALVSDANQLAMVLAFGPADGETYSGLNWVDDKGNLYACASWEATEAWVEASQNPLQRPEWDTDQIIDMVAAERAQAALVFSTEATLASTAILTAIGGMDGQQAISAMGLKTKEYQL